MRKGLKRAAKRKSNKRYPRRNNKTRQDQVIVISDDESSDSDIELPVVEGGLNSSRARVRKVTVLEKVTSTSSSTSSRVTDMDNTCLNTGGSSCAMSGEISADISAVAVTHKGRSRRCFPEMEKMTDVDFSPVKSCLLYTAQVDKYRRKKDEAFLDVPALCREEEQEEERDAAEVKRKASVAQKILTDQCTDPESEVLLNTAELMVEETAGPEKRKTINRNEKLFSKFDQMKFQYEELELNLDSSLTEDLEIVNKTPVTSKKDFIIRIRWKADIFTFHLGSSDQFHRLMPDIAAAIEAPAEKIQLMLNDEFVNLFQTPAEISFRVGTIIDCFVTGDNKLSNSESTEKDPNTIELKIQSNTDRKKSTIRCHKLQPLRKLVEDYAAMKSLDPKSLQLKFDGDTLDLEETPHDLDMEEGDCLDIVLQL